MTTGPRPRQAWSRYERAGGGRPRPAGAGTVDRRTPAEAFALLDNEIRLSILEALSDAGESLTFSALRERVGERDSGKFNYHLGKLAGHFVRRTETGYELTLAGDQIVGALLAGTYTADVSLDPIEIDNECPNCGGGPLVAEYADEYVTVTCADCEPWFNRFTFPPGTVEQFDRDELPGAFDRWLRSEFQRIVAGFCTTCSGRMVGRLELAEDRPEPAQVTFHCDRCGDTATASPSMALFYHPAAIGFYYDHGIDVTRTPSWEVSARQDVSVEVVSEDPITVRVTARIDDEVLEATIDERARVAAIERRDASAG